MVINVIHNNVERKGWKNTLLDTVTTMAPPCGNSVNSLQFTHFKTMGLSYIAFIMLRYAPSIPAFWRVLIINGCCILSKAISASIEIIIWFLSFNLLMWCINSRTFKLIFSGGCGL